MKKEILEEALQTKTGFKEIIRGMFSFARVKKSFEIYSSADQKGVFENVCLKKFSSNGNVYAIVAFCTQGNISTEVKSQLISAAESFTLGSVRQECIKYKRLQKWRGEIGSFAYKNRLITSLSNEEEGILVYPIMYKEKKSCKYVVYAKTKHDLFIYPIKDRLFDIKYFAINYLTKVKSLQRQSAKSAL